ncbi:hypothetical protein GGR51DRAFT_121379 [Nemania sp. FL0031]|nr:hypothetical protein GGR51DRAFT_121379 [Nemania sp. FL0031]
MFRLGIHNTLIRSTFSGLRSPILKAPIVLSTKLSCHIAPPDEIRAQPRDQKVISLRNKYSEKAHRSFSTSSFDEKPEPKWVFAGGEWCRPPSTLGPETRINFQDVRGHGPLFEPRAELGTDPEKAREEWRELCKAYKQKHGIATALWEKNSVLEMRYKVAEAMLERKEHELAAVYAERDEQVRNNKMLHGELAYAKGLLSALHRNRVKWPEYFRLREAERRRRMRDNAALYTHCMGSSL